MTLLHQTIRALRAVRFRLFVHYPALLQRHVTGALWEALVSRQAGLRAERRRKAGGQLSVTARSWPVIFTGSDGPPDVVHFAAVLSGVARLATGSNSAGVALYIRADRVGEALEQILAIAVSQPTSCDIHLFDDQASLDAALDNALPDEWRNSMTEVSGISVPALTEKSGEPALTLRLADRNHARELLKRRATSLLHVALTVPPAETCDAVALARWLDELSAQAWRLGVAVVVLNEGVWRYPDVFGVRRLAITSADDSGLGPLDRLALAEACDGYLGDDSLFRPVASAAGRPCVVVDDWSRSPAEALEQLCQIMRPVTLNTPLQSEAGRLATAGNHTTSQ